MEIYFKTPILGSSDKKKTSTTVTFDWNFNG